MLKIRLLKPGKSIKGRYHHKVVVIEHGNARDGKFVEELGFYNPQGNLLKLDMDIYKKWYDKGARPSETVASLVKRYQKQVAASK